ncbi:MAG: hypothetical protein KBT29_12585 [Prevotellaceae bacterium]|nr:hypothetical protein [Candidatus Minthosoma caballi]
MRTIFIQPSGFCRHENNFEFWLYKEGNEYVVSESQKGSMKIECKTLQDDYTNGIAEFKIHNCRIDLWQCEYVRTSWNWNSSSAFLLVDRSHHPISIKKIFNLGIAQKTLKELCKYHIAYLINSSVKMLNACKTEKELVKMIYEI